MDVVFAYSCVGGRQIQQVVVPGLSAFQLVLRILCLPLEEGKSGCESRAADGRDLRFSLGSLPAISSPHGPGKPYSMGQVSKIWTPYSKSSPDTAHVQPSLALSGKQWPFPGV